MNELLDLYFAKDGHEPDWAAIRTHIYRLHSPRTALFDVLQTLWAVYESDEPAEQMTLLFALRKGL